MRLHAWEPLQNIEEYSRQYCQFHSGLFQFASFIVYALMFASGSRAIGILSNLIGLQPILR